MGGQVGWGGVRWRNQARGLRRAGQGEQGADFEGCLFAVVALLDSYEHSRHASLCIAFMRRNVMPPPPTLALCMVQMVTASSSRPCRHGRKEPHHYLQSTEQPAGRLTSL